jgi:hypothetical protein
MCDAHTSAIGSLDMILAMVFFMHSKVVEAVGKVICCCRVSISSRIYWVRGCRTIVDAKKVAS